MQGKPTSIDIAYLAGVSQPTVSRALRGSPMVSEETRRRIESIAQQLNYKVDKNASNLRCQHSITRACAQRGYDLLVSFQQQSGNWHVDYEDSRKADGIILLGYGDFLEYRLRLEQLVDQGTHFVRWGAVQTGQPGLSVGCDNFHGGHEATQHLLRLGRRKIAFLGSASGHYPEFLERYRGYGEALKAAGVSVNPALQVDAITMEQSGYE